MRLSLRLTLCSCALLLAAAAPSPAPAGAAADWQRLVALDAGPATKFKTQDEAHAGALAHIAAQEKALRHYLAAYPGDEHFFEARLRLARLLLIKGTFGGVVSAQEEARKILDGLGRTATPVQRPEVDFVRLSFAMRTLRPGDPSGREDLLRATNRFAADYPADRRLAALLAEVATLFDREPETQRSLVLQAQKASPDPGLKARLNDDLKRLDLLGRVLPLHVALAQGKVVDLADYRGKVVVLVFFGEFSPPSTEAVAALQHAAAGWPKDRVQFLGVSLDSSSENLAALIRQASIAWPVIFDGKGWNGALVRSFGINRLPTVWLIDRAGKLRSLNGLVNPNQQVQELLQES
jgi:peroxiredoxin